jgi:hypothetical protein
MLFISKTMWVLFFAILAFTSVATSPPIAAVLLPSMIPPFVFSPQRFLVFFPRSHFILLNCLHGLHSQNYSQFLLHSPSETYFDNLSIFFVARNIYLNLFFLVGKPSPKLLVSISLF